MIVFYNKMIGLMNNEGAVDAVYLYFRQGLTFRHVNFKAFDTLPELLHRTNEVQPR